MKRSRRHLATLKLAGVLLLPAGTLFAQAGSAQLTPGESQTALDAAVNRLERLDGALARRGAPAPAATLAATAATAGAPPPLVVETLMAHECGNELVRACAALMWDTPEFAWAHNEVDGKVERDPEATVALTRVVLPGFIKTDSPVGCHAYEFPIQT